jgi:multidrug resistance efflux pump
MIYGSRTYTLYSLFARTLGPERKFYVLTFIYGMAISLFTLAVPFAVQLLITTLTNTALMQPIIVLSLVVFGVLCLNGVLSGLQYHLMERFKRRFYARMVSDIVLRNIHADPAQPQFDRSRLANRYFEIMTVQHKLPILLTGGFSLLLQTVVGVLLVSSYHPTLLVFNIVFLLMLYALWYAFGYRAIRSALALSKEKYAMAGWLEELGRTPAAEQTPTRAEEELRISNDHMERYLVAREKYFRPSFRQTLGFFMLYALASAGLLGIGGMLVVNGQLTLGQLVAAELILSSIFYGMSKLGDYLSHFYDLCAAVEKLSQFLNIPVSELGSKGSADAAVNYVTPSTYLAHFPALQRLTVPRITSTVGRILATFMLLLVAFLFLTPWVQTSSGVGKITAFYPADRVQTINALVKGRINTWHVRDGSHVKAGEPIAEIIDNDPQLMLRLTSERDAMQHKYESTKLAVETAEVNYKRQEMLHAKGLSARKEYEQAHIRFKELNATMAQAAADLNKVEVQLARQATQTVRAPRDGYVLHIAAGGISTYVKEGDVLATFVPENVKQAVELYVNGLDIPLIQPGRKVRLMFEGWPSVQFSGWPSVAVGTFAGEVAVVDASVSPNGKFRVVVTETPDEPWPDSRFLRIGAQAKGWVLLNRVSVGYELWRKMNNFPPTYDQPLQTQGAQQKPSGEPAL